jgi:hypothetical protein
MFKDQFVVYDNILDGITFDDLITAVLSNEPEVNERTVKKVFKEILETQLKDADYLLEQHMQKIIAIVKDNRE